VIRPSPSPSVVVARIASATERWRCDAAEAARGHPRHVVLALLVAGLLLGGRAPDSIVVVGALATAATAMRRPAIAVALAMVLIGGAYVGQARTASLEATRLAIGHDVQGEATVLAAPRPDAYGGARALIRWRGEPVLLRIPSWWHHALPAVGDIVDVSGTLRPPDLAASAVHAHATLRASDLRATGRHRGGPLGAVDAIRRRAERVLGAHLPPGEAALARGMVLGDDSGMPDDLRDAFTAASLSHLTAASGQNIALLAALALGLGVALGIGIRARWALVLALIMVYVPLAGGGPSIQRAGVMGAATIVAALAGRPASRWYGLLLAAAVTLLLDPRSAGDPGWQLSFAAVAGIALLAPRAAERLHGLGLPRAVAETVGVTLAATLSTAPLIALHFERASLVGLPANVIAAPAVAPIMWLGMAEAAVAQVAPGVAAPLTYATAPLLGFLTGVARTAAAAPAAQVALPLGLLTLLCALGAAAILRGRPAQEGGPPRRRLRLRIAVALAGAAATALALLLARTSTLAPPPAGDLRITALDIGQGDATLLQAGGHAVLVDAGPPGTPIVAELRHAGVTRLDALVVTHPQADHDGGAPAVLNAVPTALLLDGRGGDRSPTSTAIDRPLQQHATRTIPAQQGEQLTAGPLTLDVLWPPAEPAADPGDDPNERAIVAVATAYGSTALLTADAESDVLAPLDLPVVDVLKVSHHGSDDPGLADVLTRLRPQIALIEVGAHNTYGHPTPTTLTTLHETVPRTLRTDQDGTTRIDLVAHHATVTTER
jgi:competence protein ComEC